MSTFNLQYLANNRALVSGVDDAGASHQLILSTVQYLALDMKEMTDEATKDYNEMVAEFYAPITEAAKLLEDFQKDAAANLIDPDLYLVVQEEVEGVEAKQQQLLRLDHGTVIIRLIEQGDTDRLIWVGDSIELLTR